jgi:regulatory protein
MLARKGYGSGLAGWVVREALDEDRSREDADQPGTPDEPGLDAWLP